MNARQYHKEMEEIIDGLKARGERPGLLLHSCCAPCSSHCLTCLTDAFAVTDFYDNPNITEKEEFDKRAAELRRLLETMPGCESVRFLAGEYDPDRFFSAVRGYEDCPEGGERCAICFRLRLAKSAGTAAALGIPYVTTTLTLSPLKDAALLNAIGEEEAERFGVTWLPSDFKKKGGVQHSVELSKAYGLYRQDYCGCVFSKRRDYGTMKNRNERG